MKQTRVARLMLGLLMLAALAACASKETLGMNEQRGATSGRGTAETGEAAVEREVLAMLDAPHIAASKADGDAYFALYAPEAVFIGTDAGERWTKEEFQAYAEPYFSQGKGWTYTPRPGTRHVTVLPETQGRVAFFEELLDNAKYGTCRGTGVVRRIDGKWRVCQYHLTFPVPNDMAEKVTAEIKVFERKEK